MDRITGWTGLLSAPALRAAERDSLPPAHFIRSSHRARGGAFRGEGGYTLKMKMGVANERQKLAFSFHFPTPIDPNGQPLDPRSAEILSEHEGSAISV